MVVKKKSGKKKSEEYTCLWYYHGGKMMTEHGSKEHIYKFAQDIQKNGGSATTYKGRV